MRTVLAARLAGSLLVLATGGIHLWLYFDYFHLVHVVGVLFLLNAASAVAIGVALALSSRVLWALAGIGFSAATLAGFFVSVEHGLFGYTESLRGGWQEAAFAVELATIVVLSMAAAVLRNPTPPAGRVTPQRKAS